MKPKGVMRYFALMIFVTVVVTFTALFICKLFGLLILLYHMTSRLGVIRGTSLKISPDLLPSFGENPILAQLFVFLYLGYCKGDILLT